MKIALIGYGKMGKAIEQLAVNNGHTIVCKFSNPDYPLEDLKTADVAIEFTQPESAKKNILNCFSLNIPVVVGTTGWYSDFDEICNYATQNQSSIFYATNFSLGVNLFFELNKHLATLMNSYPMYEPVLEEIHHTLKKDSPSGTAITLAEGILEHLDRKKTYVNRSEELKEELHPLELNIVSKRIGEVPGTHSISYQSEIDEIKITHQAYNRMGFATGALKAAEWLLGKKGVYTMSDMLGFKK